MLTLRTFAAAAAATCTLALAAGTATAEPVTLKFGHVFPETHYIWQHGGKHFADAVAASGTGIDFQYFPAGQLGRDYVSAMESGLADVAILVPSYTPAKLPLTSVAELPVAYKDGCEGTAKLWHIARDGGPLAGAELAPQGMRALFVTVLPGYKIVTTGKRVATMADVAGLKLRAAGPAMEQTARAYGATPIQITGPETYDAMQRGTVDGAFFPYHAIPAFGLEPLIKNGIEGPSIGTATVIFAMSQAKWDALTDDQRAAIDNAAMASQAYTCRWLEDEEARVRQEMIDKHGYAPVVLSADDTAAWQARLSSVSDDWVSRMESQKLPGGELLKAFRDAPTDLP
ncbi:TRAP transporter substrate-binding protein DctP [Ruixingdingia sedimenti]|uniref:TRAP transporter substrate-binding protein DctP n=1 Tax=Ruixingdingia sedimenti TaxID=3073604 RepID=A0ABU1F497_9RHOB|nr:TRAP transporter substrate-binding protein DctP [Xinfangfangia sp. LG-4]MDR5651682.1 TRAP transporter substrate-binding protein DctP [Xinfangfangia sp. LG-4]